MPQQRVNQLSSNSLGLDALSQKILEHALTAGNNASGNNGNDKNSAWQKMMAQMAMAQKMNPRTMLGFAAGKLLRQLFDGWKENYQDRGDRKAKKALEGGDSVNPSATNPIAQKVMRENTPSGDWLGQGTGNAQPSPLVNYKQEAMNKVLPIPQSQDELLSSNIADSATPEMDLPPALSQLDPETLRLINGLSWG